MSPTARPLDRQRRLQLMTSMACLGIGLLVAAGSAVAQATIPSSSSAQMPASPSPSAAATERAYEELDWTGRRAAVPVVRKEARAALVAGRRHCNQMRQGNERRDCLRVVQEDYQEMMNRVQARTARR